MRDVANYIYKEDLFYTQASLFLIMQSVSITEEVIYFYEDSGAPKSAVYTTLICIHGLGFNGGKRHRLSLI